MIPRHLAPTLERAARAFPVVSLTGPRRAGKTRLLRSVFPDYAYVCLESPEDRAEALAEPRGLLARFPGRLILDEAQHAPDLFSYIQVAVDEVLTRGGRLAGRFILAGSQNFLGMRRITQSLAGRVRILHLPPLGLGELARLGPRSPEDLLSGAAGASSPAGPEDGWAERAVRGFFPPAPNGEATTAGWYSRYFQAYLRGEVRDLLRVGDLDAFGRFVSLCAGSVGATLSRSAIGKACGVTHDTVRRWIEVLETGFVVFQLHPYLRNFRRPLTRRPKLYFLDTGLLCWLLGIRTGDQLRQHPRRGAVFENFIIAEVLKAEYNAGEYPRLSFFRDRRGNEVPLVVETRGRPHAVEIASGETLDTDSFRGLRFWTSATGETGPRTLVYGGDKDRPGPDGISVRSWRGWR